jgi:hypothetical protein
VPDCRCLWIRLQIQAFGPSLGERSGPRPIHLQSGLLRLCFRRCIQVPPGSLRYFSASVLSFSFGQTATTPDEKLYHFEHSSVAIWPESCSGRAVAAHFPPTCVIFTTWTSKRNATFFKLPRQRSCGTVGIRSAIRLPRLLRAAKASLSPVARLQKEGTCRQATLVSHRGANR